MSEVTVKCSRCIELEAKLAEAQAKLTALEADYAEAQDIAVSESVGRRTAEAEVERLREALKVAREYVKAVEAQIQTRPNIAMKDRKLCDAALRGGGK